MSDKDKNVRFFSSVGNTDPVTKEWVEVGQVESTYLTDANGNFIKDPATGEYYIVPVGYDPQDTIRRFSEKTKVKGFDITDPMDDSLYGYRTDGPLDLQRNFNGKSFG
ncbi:MAG: hypothetical protein PHU14_13150, partial [Methylovulum sp.]|nr:hypothetical protein [Methylovulum sp.]